MMVDEVLHARAKKFGISLDGLNGSKLTELRVYYNTSNDEYDIDAVYIFPCSIESITIPINLNFEDKDQ